MNLIRIILIFLILFTCITSNELFSQDDNADSIKTNKGSEINDTLKKIISVDLNDILVQLIKKQNEEKRLKNLRDEHIAKIYLKLDEIKFYFSKGIDTVRYNSVLKMSEEGYKLTYDVIENTGVNTQTPRNLVTSLLLNKELLRELEIIDKEVKVKIREISDFRKSLDTLGTDTILFKFPSDSIQSNEYFIELIRLSKAYDPVDSLALSVQGALENISNNISNTGSNLNECIRKIENIRAFDEFSFFKGSLTNKNSNPIWESSSEFSTSGESFKYSSRKSLRLLLFYLVNNTAYLLIFILIAALLYFTARKLKTRITQTESLAKNFGHSLFVTSPLTLTLFVITILYQIILPRPPFIVSGLVFLIEGVLLFILLFKKPGRKYMFAWAWVTILYFFAYNNNLFLTVTVFERWLLLLLATISSVSVIVLKRKAVDFIQNKRWLNNILILCFVVFVISGVANILGYVNLSNLIFSTSILTIFLSIIFYAAYSFIKELVLILLVFSKESKNERFEKSMDSIRYGLPAILKYTFIFSGIIIISRNFYIYDYFADGLSILMKTERSLGDFTFKIESVALFIIIVAVSLIASRLISFYSELNTANLLSDNKDRKGIGNWLLLIRIAVFSAGVLIAFASSGIPMDRLTIILGSLGVGIGLGLQSLVGNLVSGVFLAFEKPVKIGDQIEVDNNSGVIKEIGIRSSKIETFDGSDIIIPNVDLLTKHVVNWTRKNNKRRADILQNFDNVKDVSKCKELIMKLLDENPEVDKIPPPIILVNKFGGSGVEFRILFWTDINIYLQVKSEVYYRIQEAFLTDKIGTIK